MTKDEVTQAFNDWWDSEYDPTGNPFKQNSYAYWAWAGWKAAEQPAQQEPVVWMYVNKSTHETKFQKHMRDFIDHSLWLEVPLYGEPLANHELQCICGAIWLGDEMVHLPDKRPPPQRTWVGLTDEDELDWEDGGNLRDLVKAIEAALKAKNT